MNILQSTSVLSIVLTWNSADYIEKCLNSLLDSKFKTKVLVVDNNSSDNTRGLIAANHPSVEIINTGENLGYAGGNNYALRHVKDMGYEYYFILNPDAYVHSDCIGELVKALVTQPALAAASPIIYRKEPNIVWYAGSEIHWENGATPHIGNNQVDKGQFKQMTRTGRLNGCAMMLRPSAISQVGLMDENFFLYYEETDWSVRFKEAGYELGFVPSAKVWHEASSSTGGFNNPIYEYYMTRNKLYFMHKHKKYTKKLYSIRILYRLGFNALVLLKKQGIYTACRATAYQLKGILDYLRHRYGRNDTI